jgi:ribosomal protein L14E/L6E/L27E
MDISKSDIVISLAGRDKGKFFFVLETDGEFLVLADGKTRKLENPKRKKRKHISLAARTDSRVAGKILAGEPILNSELRRDLAIFGQKFNSQNQGG